MESSPSKEHPEIPLASLPEHREHAIAAVTGGELPEGYFSGKYYIGTVIGAGFASLSVRTPPYLALLAQVLNWLFIRRALAGSHLLPLFSTSSTTILGRTKTTSGSAWCIL